MEDKGKHIHTGRSEKWQNMSNVAEKQLPGRDLQECLICARHFTSDRIKAHEAICQKTSGVVRKAYDVAQQRIKGTEAERFKKMAARRECSDRAQKICSSGLSTNWRGKHEHFMKKIKDAKEVANEKAFKANDLPFPPPEDYDKDYVQCQYCLRKFNSRSAARHITTCANRTCFPKSERNFDDNSNSTNNLPGK